MKLHTRILIGMGVDRILDMCRTVVNITGDATCAAFIARSVNGRPTPIPQETLR